MSLTGDSVFCIFSFCGCFEQIKGFASAFGDDEWVDHGNHEHQPSSIKPTEDIRRSVSSFPTGLTLLKDMFSNRDAFFPYIEDFD